ncbi:helix-turn-helix domain-containing protein [Hathewaya massiliensis]|uniref:helix-turn-helix domain-containing protein n=1 Tax=Hathewaya massiliensis TaxID=1964382 RepID=UPI0011586A97|nr:helix-turn-helix domain-containing protein [Hathewaya massiliensis]
MKLTGKQILESKELQELLQSFQSRVLAIKWGDRSVSDGRNRNIYVEKVGEFNELSENKTISVVEGLWSEPIRENMVLTIEDPDIDLYRVYTTTEAALLWGKDESTIRKAIQNGKFEQWFDYRKAGRITLITKDAMERVYGKLK